MHQAILDMRLATCTTPVDELAALVAKTDPGNVQTKRSQAHFATGRIRYNPGSKEEDGTIICLKPTLLDGDPADVLAYAKKNQSFPHDTTANQWFDEARFENYRALGEAVGAAASSKIADEVKLILR